MTVWHQVSPRNPSTRHSVRSTPFDEQLPRHQTGPSRLRLSRCSTTIIIIILINTPGRQRLARTSRSYTNLPLLSSRSRCLPASRIYHATTSDRPFTHPKSKSHPRAHHTKRQDLGTSRRLRRCLDFRAKKTAPTPCVFRGSILRERSEKQSAEGERYGVPMSIPTTPIPSPPSCTLDGCAVNGAKTLTYRC